MCQGLDLPLPAVTVCTVLMGKGVQWKRHGELPGWVQGWKPGPSTQTLLPCCSESTDGLATLWKKHTFYSHQLSLDIMAVATVSDPQQKAVTRLE